MTDDEKRHCRLEVGVQLESLDGLLDAAVIVAAVEERDGEDVIDDWRRRIELPGSLRLRSRLREAALGGEDFRVPLVRRRISGPQLDGPLELPLGSLPVVIMLADGTEGSVTLGQGIVELDRLERVGLRLRQDVRGAGAAVVHEQAVAIRQTGVRQRKVGVEGNGPFEESLRLSQRLFGTLVPQVAALQIQVVG